VVYKSYTKQVAEHLKFLRSKGFDIKNLVVDYIFADNDHHLSQNRGIQKAQEVCKALNKRVTVVAPEFGGTTPSKSASDWNDLVRIMGTIEVKRQINYLC